MLEIKLFGPGYASYRGKPLNGFPGQQASLLLCYLLLNPHSHHRERLAAVFWADYSANASRKNLSQNLWRLRQTFQEVDVPENQYLHISKERISFDTSSNYWLDIEEFEAVVLRYQDIAGDQLTQDQAIDLEAAVALYNGDLLEGVYEDWCLHDRERLSLLYLDALGKLMIFHEGNQTYEQGLACGERILESDNTRERVHQQMMRLYWLVGHRSAALAQYKRCTQILQEELGVTPMPETSQLYQQMLHNEFQPHLIVSTSLSGTALSPLIRSEESLQKFADQSLHKLSRLQTIIDETSAELRSLERLIRRTLLDSE
jgi:DNA-binding SARP family transcriptional activator